MASASATAMSVSKSTGSEAPATGFHEAHQIEVDPRNSSMRVAQTSSPSAIVSSSSGRAPQAGHDFVDRELISSTSRLSRLPTKVPSSLQPSTSSTPAVAISAYLNNNNTYTGQDVHVSVNTATSSTSSPAIRTFGQHSSPLETPVSSFSQPITQHGLTHPIRRPRTSNQVFQSSTDLAAHYGIPQILPPAPRTTARYLQAPPKQSSPLADFQTLSANYLNMLSKKPTDTSVAAPSAPVMSSTVSSTELEAPLIPADSYSESQLQNIADILAASPEFRDQDYFDSYMTSPLMPGLDDEFGVSPSETPYSDFLTTPLFNDDAMLTSPGTEYMDMPLFADIDYGVMEKQDELVVPAKVPTADFDDLYTISPGTPALDSFDPAHLYPTSRVPSNLSSDHSSVRRTKATGIRKGVTPDTLLDEDAPTQPRKYAIPSATSRKELPAVFARKRSRSTAFGDEEDQLDDLPPNPTEKDLIEQKRRQNTVAARRSRKRKLEQFQMMEKSRNEERQLKEQWQERANVLLNLVRTMGVKYPDFPQDQPEYADA
ncbi:hypothetical protein GALMADRAFT_239027 [Galerina marginata CBS 339.88]|uniref:BZIP domain-containing protein n=1 Tax=Galerina marginata (strain CBS 339.88) TaxID=685588 RepID=A0A067TTD8_GALM3|nr:hypothetical protein GALMADRAFT_239027 [Galerina marginata CBS 339.88]